MESVSHNLLRKLHLKKCLVFLPEKATGGKCQMKYTPADIPCLSISEKRWIYKKIQKSHTAVLVSFGAVIAVCIITLSFNGWLMVASMLCMGSDVYKEVFVLIVLMIISFTLSTKLNRTRIIISMCIECVSALCGIPFVIFFLLILVTLFFQIRLLRMFPVLDALKKEEGYPHFLQFQSEVSDAEQLRQKYQ